ncbi:MAG TPA: class I SAM-dependent methyltransferase [Saprospiraceae bacterium]|nr:class I SAM-dependent methyltransferase [Saprospiraceae bacterium]
MKMLLDKIEFKNENLDNWKNNTEYWLNNPLRQVEDTKDFFIPKLKELISEESSVLDMGCGSGWLLEFIRQIDLNTKYYGIDFNEKFIEALRIKNSNDINASFDTVDFENELSSEYFEKFDIVFNCFNFFETANLDVAFANAVKMLKPNGKLVIFTIEYTFLILALSHNMEEFKKYLKIYDEAKNKGVVPYFFQNIDLGNAESETLKYASVLYSFDDYYKQATKHSLSLADYGEVVKTAKFLPKTYQYFVFKKN